MSKYNIIPQTPNSIYKEELWSGKLFNGRDIIISIVDIYESGYFTMELSNHELKSILKKTNVVLNDYKLLTPCLEEKGGYFTLLRNISNYTMNEINEINKLIYNDIETTKDIRNSDFIDKEMLEENWFTHDDTIYGIEHTKCLYEKL